MSNVWWRELRGWCKSFTRTEAYLSLLQLIFSIGFIALLIFVIIHLRACNVSEPETIQSTTISVTSTRIVTGKPTATQPVTEKFSIATQTGTQKTPESENISTKPTPLPKQVKCTWTPSLKTTPVTRYYDSEAPTTTVVKMNVTGSVIHSEFLLENSDGEPASSDMKGHLLALVKLRPPHDVTFGCTLTIVAEKWTLTAASCIEAIEELDSLDSFVMMERFGEEMQGRLHAVSEIMIHPLYQGTNRSYDLAALKSENSLISERSNIILLANLIDYLSVTIGERLTLLGYGRFRSMDSGPLRRGLREVGVRRLPLEQCAGEAWGGAWALRHLAGGARVARGGGRAAPLCAGAAPGPPCTYCAGAPLVLRRALLGLMSHNQHCGLACPPALYVNVALQQDWIDSIVYSD